MIKRKNYIYIFALFVLFIIFFLYLFFNQNMEQFYSDPYKKPSPDAPPGTIPYCDRMEGGDCTYSLDCWQGGMARGKEAEGSCTDTGPCDWCRKTYGNDYYCCRKDYENNSKYCFDCDNNPVGCVGHHCCTKICPSLADPPTEESETTMIMPKPPRNIDPPTLANPGNSLVMLNNRESAPQGPPGPPGPPGIPGNNGEIGMMGQTIDCSGYTNSITLGNPYLLGRNLNNNMLDENILHNPHNMNSSINFNELTDPNKDDDNKFFMLESDEKKFNQKKNNKRNHHMRNKNNNKLNINKSKNKNSCTECCNNNKIINKRKNKKWKKKKYPRILLKNCNNDLY